LNKHFVSLLLLSTILSQLPATISVYSQRTSALGGAGLADVEGYENPANLSLRDVEDSDFLYYLSYQDTYDWGDSSLSDSVPLIQQPVSYLGATFFGTGISMTVQAKNSLTDKVSDDSGSAYFTAVSDTLVQVDFSLPTLYTIKSGMRIKGSSEVERLDSEIRSGLLTIPDYFIQTFLERTEYVEGSEDYAVQLGMREDVNDQWSFALFTDLYSKDTQNNVDSFSDTFSLGSAFSTATYADDNSLNLLKFKVDADVLNVLNSDDREFRFGSELKFQFLRNYSLSLLAGTTIYQEIDDDTTTCNASILYTTPSSTYLLGTSVSLATLKGDSSAFSLYLSGQFSL